MDRSMLHKIVTVSYKYPDRNGGHRHLYPTTGKILIVGREGDKFMLTNVECESELDITDKDSPFQWGIWINTWEIETLTIKE
jgi:hypothetical protein